MTRDVRYGRSPVVDRVDQAETLEGLFHRLNNQLGIVLANAELVESKAADAAGKSRASQIVAAALEAMAMARDLRELVASRELTDSNVD